MDTGCFGEGTKGCFCIADSLCVYCDNESMRWLSITKIWLLTTKHRGGIF